MYLCRTKRITMDMKKIYIAPEIETINCMPGSVILDGSRPEVEDSKQSNEDEFDGDATGAARGDWNNIWEGL